MAGTREKLALLCCAAVALGVAIAADRRATATMAVSATVVPECTVDSLGPSNQPGCIEASRRLQQPATTGAAATQVGSTKDQNTVPTNGASTPPRAVVLIRF
jgi:hypothetical protein